MNKLPLVYDAFCLVSGTNVLLKVYSDYCTFVPFVIELIKQCNYNSICSDFEVYVSFKNMKCINGMHLIPIFIVCKYSQYSHTNIILWVSYCDFINKKIIIHRDFKPSSISIKVSKSWPYDNHIEKCYIKNNVYDNDGDYDRIIINRTMDNIIVGFYRYIQSNHSFIKPVSIMKDFPGDENEKLEIWKAYNKHHRFNGPAFTHILDDKFHDKLHDEVYYFNEVKIPDNIITFNNGIPSKELNKSSVLEAMLFDRAYGKAVDIMYKTQNIPTEEEIYKFAVVNE